MDLESLFRQRKQDWNADLNLLAQDLSFRVPEKIIVDDINLRMCPGQFIGLIGPSGCGKTTLMLMLKAILGPAWIGAPQWSLAASQPPVLSGAAGLCASGRHHPSRAHGARIAGFHQPAQAGPANPGRGTSTPDQSHPGFFGSERHGKHPDRLSRKERHQWRPAQTRQHGPGTDHGAAVLLSGRAHQRTGPTQRPGSDEAPG